MFEKNAWGYLSDQTSLSAYITLWMWSVVRDGHRQTAKYIGLLCRLLPQHMIVAVVLNVDEEKMLDPFYIFCNTLALLYKICKWLKH